MSLGVSNNRTRFVIRTDSAQYFANTAVNPFLLGVVPLNQQFRITRVTAHGTLPVIAAATFWKRLYWTLDGGTTKHEIATPFVYYGASQRRVVNESEETDLVVPEGAQIGCLMHDTFTGIGGTSVLTGIHFTIEGFLERPKNSIQGPTSRGEVAVADDTPVTLVTGEAGKHIILTRIGMRFLGTTATALQLRAVDDVGAGPATEIFTLWSNNGAEGFRKYFHQPVYLALPDGYGVEVEAVGTGSGGRGGCYIDYFESLNAPNFDTYDGVPT